MKENIEIEPVRISDELRVLQELQKKLESDFPGISDPGAEIVIERGNVADIDPTNKGPHKKAS